MESISFPPSTSTVNVRIIDTTSYWKFPASMFVDTKPYPNLKILEFPSYAFLVEHRNADSGKVKNYLFDLGTRKDWKNAFPPVAKMLERTVTTQEGAALEVKNNVNEILEKNGLKPESIDGIIWSHFHVDHTGDPTTFPSTTELVVGSGFKSTFVPGYPSNPKSPVLETDYQGRTLREIDFDHGGNTLELGGMRAYDFFGDGSFYLLDAPGHTIAHICGLARTTAGTSPTFIFMGADCCHHGGEFRPSSLLPLPKSVPDPAARQPTTTFCPGELFLNRHAKQSATEPFYQLPKGKGLNHDPAVATETIRKMQLFDAHPDVFVVIAHDDTLRQVVDLFPLGANEWKEKKWADTGRWRFLADIPERNEQRKDTTSRM